MGMTLFLPRVGFGSIDQVSAPNSAAAIGPFLALSVISLLHSNSVAFGAKPTSAELRLQNPVHEYAPQQICDSSVALTLTFLLRGLRETERNVRVAALVLL
jgi:hypothetical protein